MFKLFLNKENIKETTIYSTIEFLAKPDFLCVVGAKLYGTETEDSDLDIRGFTFPSPNLILGLKRWELFEYTAKNTNEDTVIWAVYKFFKMLINGSTIAFEMLNCPENWIIRQSEFAKEIIKYKNYFVSTKTITSMLGYAQSEWRKVLGETTRNLGAVRKEHIEQTGYSYKNAYHAIRILQEGIELSKYGFITFPLANKAFYIALKTGNIAFRDVECIYKDKLANLEYELKLKREAPKQDNYEFINVLLYRLNLKHILSNIITVSPFDKSSFCV